MFVFIYNLEMNQCQIYLWSASGKPAGEVPLAKSCGHTFGLH